MFYVAFFGGVVSLAMIAVANARRHGLGRDARVKVATVVLLGLVAAVVTAVLLDPDARALRYIGRGTGLLAFLAIVPLFRASERVYEHRGAEWASLWGPGLVAVLVGGLVQGVLLWLVAGGGT